MKNIVILGSTGSIGTQALDVIRKNPKGFRIVALSAYSNIDSLKKQILEFRPNYACIWKNELKELLSSWVKTKRLKTKILSGTDGLVFVACHRKTDIILSAVVGSIGLKPLYKAIKAGKRIALANKEALVVAGDILMSEARKSGAEILPVDSEHSAIFQCLRKEDPRSVRKIWLTASGGPLYRNRYKKKNLKVSEALDHPTWDMGPKITIDSSTLMNKGLEAIEAHHLFNVPMDHIEIVIHPQSIVHSLVEFVDGSVLAQLSNPDMRLPIQYALNYPKRNKSEVKHLNLAAIKKLEFKSPDFAYFPCLKLALNAQKSAGTMPAVMNAANEVAVKAFLDERISFGDIPIIIRNVMKKTKIKYKRSIETVIEADICARKETLKEIEIIEGRNK